MKVAQRGRVIVSTDFVGGGVQITVATYLLLYVKRAIHAESNCAEPEKLNIQTDNNFLPGVLVK